MSYADDIKQQNEHNTFLTACDFCNNNSVNVRTKNLMNYLKGAPINRIRNDRPDIINCCKRGSKEIFVGIEMFFVDQNSKKKNGKIRSVTSEANNHLKKIYEDGHKQLLETGDVSIEYGEKLVKQGVALAQQELNSNYSMLISSFESSFNNHAKNAIAYRENVKSVANGSNVELAFFIEIESHFHNLFFNYNNKVIPYDSKLMPFFSDIIAIINNNENTKNIDYIVFDLKSRHAKERNVVAVRTGNIKSNLKNQGITICKYAGENSLISNPSGNTYNWEDNGDITAKIVFDDSDKNGEGFIKAYNKALYFKKKGIPFITSRRIQAEIYASKAKTPEEAVALRQVFINKYPLKEKNEDDQT